MSTSEQALKALDWVRFHQDLDVALTNWILDNPWVSIKNPLIEFAQYSNQRRLEYMTVNPTNPYKERADE